MKRLVFVASALLICATTLFAQSVPGTIGVYANEEGTDCNVVDNGDVLYVHLLHVRMDGVTAVDFKLDVSATSWIHLGDNWNFRLVIGSSVEGITIGYEDCASGAVYLGSAIFIGSSAPSCTEVLIVGDPQSTSGEIEAVDCHETRIFPDGGRAVVNGDASCQCTVPVNETTWGGIKALYR